MAPSYRQQNTKVVHDGVTLFQRDDHKNPRWYYRLKLPDIEQTILRSSKTFEFERAKGIAIQEYYKLIGKVEANAPIFSKRFDAVAEAFLERRHHSRVRPLPRDVRRQRRDDRRRRARALERL